MVLYTVTGILTTQTLGRALMLLPFMLAGLWGGMRLSGRVSDKTVMGCVAALLMLSGVSLIIGNL